MLKDLIEENNYDRKRISKVVRWFLSNFFYLTIVNTTCNSLTTSAEYQYEDKHDKISDMARQLQIKTNTILDDFFVKDKKNLDRFLHQHFGLYAVNETISPGHYGLYSHELKKKLSSFGRPGFEYQVILLEKKPHIREELKCDDEHCQAFLFYETRIIIRRYAQIITPTTFENQHEWFLGCKEEIEKVFKKYPGAHRTLDQFRDHLSLKCLPPGAYKYFAFYGVYSSILNPHPLLSIDGIACLKVLGDHGYIDARSTVFGIKTYNYKIIMWP